MAGEDEIVLGAELAQEAAEGVALAVEEPGGSLEEPVVDVTPVEHLPPEAVVEEHLVVALAGEVESADGEDDLLVLAVDVDEIGRAPSVGDLVVRHALDDVGRIHPVAAGGGILGVGEVLLVDGEDGAADARDGIDLLGGGQRPGLAVVGAHVGEPLPSPAGAAQTDDALQSASHRHGHLTSYTRFSSW